MLTGAHNIPRELWFGHASFQLRGSWLCRHPTAFSLWREGIGPGR